VLPHELLPKRLSNGWFDAVGKYIERIFQVDAVAARQILDIYIEMALASFVRGSA
jgi:hypothetical protein